MQNDQNLCFWVLDLFPWCLQKNLSIMFRRVRNFPNWILLWCLYYKHADPRRANFAFLTLVLPNILRKCQVLSFALVDLSISTYQYLEVYDVYFTNTNVDWYHSNRTIVRNSIINYVTASHFMPFTDLTLSKVCIVTYLVLLLIAIFRSRNKVVDWWVCKEHF